MVMASIDWTTVIVAALTGIPATLASVLAYLNRQDLKTPSGESIGTQVERAHHITNATNALLRKTNGLEPSEETT